MVLENIIELQNPGGSRHGESFHKSFPVVPKACVLRQGQRLARNPLGQCSIGPCLFPGEVQPLRQDPCHVFPGQASNSNHLAPGPDRRQNGKRIVRQKEKHRVGRRLFQGLQQGILRLLCHHLCAFNKTDPAAGLKRLYLHFLLHIPDLFNEDIFPAFLSADPHHVRMVAGLKLAAGTADSAGPLSRPFADQSLGKQTAQGFFARASRPCK